MSHRLLLYIDILGFSSLVANGADRLADLYECIASLNVHTHPGFKTIVFSDTVLVYNTEIDRIDTQRFKADLVTMLCEFAQDLQARLIKRAIMFRALLVEGDFTHVELNSIPFYHGSALIKAHSAEKSLKAIGLFMEKSLVPYSRIFKTVEFNSHFNYTFVTHCIEHLETYGFLGSAIQSDYVWQTELDRYVVPQLLHIRELSVGESSSSNLKVREKYAKTLALYRQQYPKTMALLEKHSYAVEDLFPNLSVGKWIEEHPRSYSEEIKERIEYR